ncbi:hypothetical protein, partial [Hugonella massiliensis]|uniref:hypothetical protein n=1 Tax=Hugonella massiliensis TaxID=1720315 RepID=UPI00073EA3B4
MSGGQESIEAPAGAKVVGKASEAASTERTDAVTGGIARTVQGVAKDVSYTHLDVYKRQTWRSGVWKKQKK